MNPMNERTMDSPMDESADDSYNNICFLPGDFSTEEGERVDRSDPNGGPHPFMLNEDYLPGNYANGHSYYDDSDDEEAYENVVFNPCRYSSDGPNISFGSSDFSDDLDVDFNPEFSGYLENNNPNIIFNPEDFSEEERLHLNQSDSDSASENSMERVRNAQYTPPRRYTVHSNPPVAQPSRLASNSNADADENRPITKRDLAVFAQTISDQYRKQHRMELKEARRIKVLAAPESGDEADHECNNPRKRRGPRARKARKGTKVELCLLVRQLAFKLMKRPPPVGNTRLSPITSVTAQEIKDFLKNPMAANQGPTLRRFVLDFNEGSGSASPWNKRAIQIFTGEFKKTHGETDHPDVLVAKTFQRHIFHLKNQFKRYLQYVDDVTQMGNQAGVLSSHDQERFIHNARMSRRDSLRGRRLEACLYFLNHPEMVRFKEIWETMPIEAISGDESDHYKGVNRYIITKLPWRAAWIHEWMLVFDRLHLFRRFNETGRATPGAFPHIRILPSSGSRPERIDRECITPPVGLPRNFYCPNWLAQQTRPFIESLEMAEPIDLTFSDELIRKASSCKYVTAHNTPPTPL